MFRKHFKTKNGMFNNCDRHFIILYLKINFSLVQIYDGEIQEVISHNLFTYT